MVVECPESFFYNPMFVAVCYCILAGITLTLVVVKFRGRLMYMRRSIKKNQSRDIVSIKDDKSTTTTSVDITSTSENNSPKTLKITKEEDKLQNGTGYQTKNTSKIK